MIFIKTKFSFDSNFVYDNDDGQQSDNLITNEKFDFNKDRSKQNWYNNAILERRLSEKSILVLKASYSNISIKKEDSLSHNSADVANILIDNNSNLNYNHLQSTNTFFRDLYLSAGVSYQSKLGDTKFIFTHKRRNINYSQKGLNYKTGIDVNGYNQDKTEYNYNDYVLASDYYIPLGNFRLNANLGIIFSEMPNAFEKDNVRIGFKYNGNLSYSPSIATNISLKYDNKPSSYPLLKHIQSNKLIDFQTIQIPAKDISIKRNETIQLTIYNEFDGFNVDIAYLKSHSENRDIFSFTNSHFGIRQLGQLASSYDIISTAIKTKILQKQLEFKLAPELVLNESENIINDKAYSTNGKIWLLGLEVNSFFRQSRFNFKLDPKYTRHEYSNDISNLKSFRNMFSSQIDIKYEIIKDRLFVDASYRHVTIKGLSNTVFNNFDVSFSGIILHHRWKLEFSNIFNDKMFETQINTPTYLSSSTNSVFGRFVKLGVEQTF